MSTRIYPEPDSYEKHPVFSAQWVEYWADLVLESWHIVPRLHYQYAKSKGLDAQLHSAELQEHPSDPHREIAILRVGGLDLMWDYKTKEKEVSRRPTIRAEGSVPQAVIINRGGEKYEALKPPEGYKVVVAQLDPFVPLSVERYGYTTDKHGKPKHHLNHLKIESIDYCSMSMEQEPYWMISKKNPNNSCYERRGIHPIRVRDQLTWWIRGELWPQGSHVPFPDYREYRPLHKRDVAATDKDIIADMVARGYTPIVDGSALSFA